MKNVIIVDDHAMLRAGLKSWLANNSDWRVTAEADSCASFFDAVKNAGPESFSAAIIDVNIGNESGFDIVKKSVIEYPKLSCLIYSMYDSAGYVLNAFALGAKGYVTKRAAETELLAALNALAAGGTYVQQSLVPDMAVTANLFAGMTKMEKIVLEQVRSGKDNQQIADDLNISHRTVENYLSRIYDKLGIYDREALLEKLGVKR